MGPLHIRIIALVATILIFILWRIQLFFKFERFLE
jgi:hypothetical protein